MNDNDIKLAARLYRKVRDKRGKVIISYHVITGYWVDNEQLTKIVEEKYPGWVIDQVVPIG